MSLAIRLLFFVVFVSGIGCRQVQPEPTAATAEPPSQTANSDVVAESDSDPTAEQATAALTVTPSEQTTASSPEPSTDVDPPAVESTGLNAKYRMLSWNVESEGADSEVIAQQLAQMNSENSYDVFALTEVLPGDFSRFRDALGEHYKYAYSKSGHNDRLQILYDESRFELVRNFEIGEINILNRYRAPLVVHLKDKADATEFLVMVNHLARGKAEIREQQATMLVAWARDQTLPVVALGDYNFDYVFSTRKGNPGFVNMMRDNIWRWIEPTTLIDTNWYDNPREPDGKDDYPGSMLDFAFVAGPAKEWDTTCNVIVRDGDFPDDKTTSDHRPFELLIAK